MGKKNKERNLGRALIRDRFGATRRRRGTDPEASSFLHTVEMNDGYDWGQLNLQSVTEESSFQEFLATAELAGTEFQAEKLNIKFVNAKSGLGLLTQEQKEEMAKLQAQNVQMLKIPRRPKWDESTTAQELQAKERDEFLEWRRKLALLQEAEGLLLTPYEKNLEFWRQLWRVIERSDVIVQIVDARNPLLFRCEDLERYVKEVNPAKMNMILVNKADFLTQEQRKTWAEYFNNCNIRVAFFSATLAACKDSLNEASEKEEDEDEEDDEDSLGEEESVVEESDLESTYTSDFIEESEYESARDDFSFADVKRVENLAIAENRFRLDAESNMLGVNNSAELLTREELISLFKTIYSKPTYTSGVTTIGLVGYPNVGKSSTINALLMDKKVSVSATPGKTKHFQTLYLDRDLLLCDCPGLVMPSFVSTKAEMILNGILPINQMKDHVPPVTMLGTLIPRHVLEDLYGIMIPRPIEGEDPDRPPIAEEILNAHAFNRGFMTQNGQPDNSRSARYILKDFVTGKLLYCVAPPECNQSEFHTFPPRKRKLRQDVTLPPRAVRATKTLKASADDLDRNFFQNNLGGAHIKGRSNILFPTISDSSSTLGSDPSMCSVDKPWKKINKHSNKKKREKSRRIYAHLDQH
ncbi:hypothetical protein QAD02_006175 [Eretmocerus hayati]|uniref:Uncharacterized protein n=1 Tax=Eretmocerus hayati TaxID=131215 RepID=A0ACC2N0L5_9HYME|nr:hypothetical protein QAD02_006175 [Eretmocerus hayati]